MSIVPLNKTDVNSRIIKNNRKFNLSDLTMGYNEIDVIFIQLPLLSCKDTEDIKMPIVPLKLQRILTIY